MFGNQVTPAMAINEASFTIRVRDQTRLDFESLKEVRMIIMMISMVMVMVISMLMLMVMVMVTVMVMVMVMMMVMQSRKNPVSASAMLTGKFLQIRKILRQVHFWLKNFRILCNTKYPDNMQSVRMNWKVYG